LATGPAITVWACTRPAGAGEDGGRSSHGARNSTLPRTVRPAVCRIRLVPPSVRSMHMGSLRVLSRVLGSCGVGASFAPPCCARATLLIATWLGSPDGRSTRTVAAPQLSRVAAARRADARVVEPAPVPGYLLPPMHQPRLATGQALTGITDVHIHVQPWRELKPHVLETMWRGQNAHRDLMIQVMDDPRALLEIMDRAGVWRVGLVNYPSPDVMGFTDASNAFAAT